MTEQTGMPGRAEERGTAPGVLDSVQADLPNYRHATSGSLLA